MYIFRKFLKIKTVKKKNKVSMKKEVKKERSIFLYMVLPLCEKEEIRTHMCVYNTYIHIYISYYYKMKQKKNKSEIN